MSIRTVTYEICGEDIQNHFLSSFVSCSVGLTIQETNPSIKHLLHSFFNLREGSGGWRMVGVGGSAFLWYSLQAAHILTHCGPISRSQFLIFSKLLKRFQRFTIHIILCILQNTRLQPKHVKWQWKVSIFSITILSILNTKISGHPIEATNISWW